ncbi:MAG: alpha/beta fold hydrolase [Pseudomonadota bacterium]
MEPLSRLTPQIFLHGAGLNAESWGSFPADFPATALNLPGHGGRARAPKATAEAFAEAIEQQVPKRAALIGYSLGGMVAMAFAHAYPDRLSALILVDTPIRAPLKFISWYTPYVAPIVTRFPGVKAIGKAVGSRVEDPEGQAEFRRHLANASPRGLADALIVAGGFDGAQVLPGLTLPMLVLCGERSLLTGPRYREMVKKACPQAKIEVMDTGHHIPFDDAPGMHGRIADFLNTL